MKFVMSYSGGKDSTLALDKMLSEGHEAVMLLVVVNRENERSFFHGADLSFLGKISNAIGIPLAVCPSNGEDYHLRFEDGLKKAKEMGAEACVFGDIDIQSNRKWGEDRCANCGIKAIYPLWQRNREENTKEVISKGYKCIIKTVDTEKLPKELLGKFLDEETVDIMKKHDVDICGENGEYHTVIIGGPIFSREVEYSLGEILDFGHYSVIDIKAL